MPLLPGTGTVPDSPEGMTVAMRSRTTKYLLIGYLVKTLVLGIVWVLVPESRDWARAFTAPIFALVGCGGDRNPNAASPTQ